MCASVCDLDLVLSTQNQFQSANKLSLRLSAFAFVKLSKPACGRTFLRRSSFLSSAPLPLGLSLIPLPFCPAIGIHLFSFYCHCQNACISSPTFSCLCPFVWLLSLHCCLAFDTNVFLLNLLSFFVSRFSLLQQEICLVDLLQIASNALIYPEKEVTFCCDLIPFNPKQLQAFSTFS